MLRKVKVYSIGILEDFEIESLERFSNIDCEGIKCVDCPLRLKLDNSIGCFKDLCKEILANNRKVNENDKSN